MLNTIITCANVIYWMLIRQRLNHGDLYKLSDKERRLHIEAFMLWLEGNRNKAILVKLKQAVGKWAI